MGISVSLSLKNNSQTINYEDVKTTYEKGSFYVINDVHGRAIKFPLVDIWAVVEDYGPRHTHVNE
jgi:hypothetical protein